MQVCCTPLGPEGVAPLRAAPCHSAEGSSPQPSRDQTEVATLANGEDNSSQVDNKITALLDFYIEQAMADATSGSRGPVGLLHLRRDAESVASELLAYCPRSAGLATRGHLTSTALQGAQTDRRRPCRLRHQKLNRRRFWNGVRIAPRRRSAGAPLGLTAICWKQRGRTRARTHALSISASLGIRS
eukprot:s8626_g3.t1